MELIHNIKAKNLSLPTRNRSDILAELIKQEIINKLFIYI